jgi:nitroreductase
VDLFEAIGTLRAMRRLKPDPVSDEELWTILDAAVKAPSGGNSQPWNFLVIRDTETKQKIADCYLDGWNRIYGPFREFALADPATARTYRSAEHLAHHLAEVPVLILATVQRNAIAPGSPAGASIYPAAQNLMLAARALGLGTTLTTLHRERESEVKTLLGIPDEVDTMALIPVGRPKGRFGPPSRLPVEQVTYWDRWGKVRSR